MNKNIWGDFQICISVHLRNEIEVNSTMNVTSSAPFHSCSKFLSNILSSFVHKEVVSAVFIIPKKLQNIICCKVHFRTL